jgi:hypothetical protein
MRPVSIVVGSGFQPDRSEDFVPPDQVRLKADPTIVTHVVESGFNRRGVRLGPDTDALGGRLTPAAWST